MSNLAFLFPGQGSQAIGMGQELAAAFPSAKAVFEEVDEALGESLSSLMWTGNIDTLTLTSNAQPALMAVSLAAVHALETEFGVSITAAQYVAGHSLGEYSALAAAGAIDIATTAKLLRIRGDAMQAAVPAGEGAMAALLGASPEQAEAACTAALSAGKCTIANDNAPGQIVISGTKSAVELATEHAKDNGVKKAMMLAVSAPFHSPLMQPAADRMAVALAEASVLAPKVDVICNVTARPENAPESIRENLIEQVTGRVRWRESVEWMASNGVSETAELGAGKVLTVMNRRTAKEVAGVALNTPEDLENFATTLNA